MLCRVAAVKCLPVHHYSAAYTFWSFGIIEFILVILKKSSAEAGARGMAGVAYLITGREQTQ